MASKAWRSGGIAGGAHTAAKASWSSVRTERRRPRGATSIALAALVVLLAACGVPAPAVDVRPGTTVWSDLVASVAVEDEVLAVAVGADGEVAFGGATYGDVGADPNQGGADGFVALLEADGSERWRVQIGDVGEDRVADLAVRADGVVVAVGTIAPSADGGDAFAFAFDGATGAVLWKLGVITPEADAAVAVVVAPDGTAFVAGTTRGTVPPAVNAGFRDAFLMRLTPAGVADGYLQFGGPGFDEAVDLVLLPDGDLVLVGATGDAVPGATGAGPLFAARFAPDLAAPPTWVVQAGGTLDVVAGAAAVDPDGDVVVVGQVSGQVGADPAIDDYDVFVARIAAGGGAPAFVRQVGTAGSDEAVAVVVDAAGRTWVAGTTTTLAPGGDASEAMLYVFGADDALLLEEVVPVGAFAGAQAVALAADREVGVGGWSAAAAPGDRSGWDGFVVRRRHAP